MDIISNLIISITKIKIQKYNGKQASLGAIRKQNNEYFELN